MQRLIRSLLAGLSLVAFPAVLAAQTDIRPQIDAILADPWVAKVHCGVRVLDLTNSNAELYNVRAEETFTPASNMKLLPTAAALDRLGEKFSFVTVFALRGDDLLVLGSGDPGLGDPRLADQAKQPIDAVFVAVADALKKAGITRIAGDVVVDDTVFDRQYAHPDWPADQLDEWYSAEVGGFNFNDNCVDFRLAPSADGKSVLVEVVPQTRFVTVVNKAKVDPTVRDNLVGFPRAGLTNTFTVTGRVKARMGTPESMPIHDPPMFAGHVLADTLERQGIPVAGAKRVRLESLRQPDGSLPAGARELMRHEQPLGPCLCRCNTYSQNFFAEAILKALGAYRGGSTRPVQQGSWATGRAEVLAFLQAHKLALPPGLVIDDGSGLSKANQVSPALLTDLLAMMSRDPSAELWYDTLPEGGVDGTLRKRFKNLNAQTMVLAKTGSLATARSLSGYVLTADKRLFAFSILFDRISPGQTWKGKELADKIVALLSTLKK